MRFDLRASKGFALDTMPYLDSLASHGLEFDKAYTPNPTCMPARVSMFTGRVPSCHKVRTNHNASDAVYTKDMLDVLKENGYMTALCGKNHSHLSYADFDFCKPTSHLGGEYREGVTEQEKKFDEYLKTLDFCDSMTPSPFSLKEQLPYRNVSDFFLFFDKCREAGKPSFAWVSFAEPHNPYQVPYPYYDMFPIDKLPKIETDISDIKGKGLNYEFAYWSWEKVYGKDKEKRILRDRSNYYGMLRLIDDQIKRLVEGIKARGEEKNTLFIFLSDHGEFIGEYDMIRKGTGVAELLVHVPMIMSGYGIEKIGHDTKDFVNIIDIFPTVCNLLGTEIPFGVQGKSLLPIMQNSPYPEKDFSIAFSESGFGGLFWDKNHDALTPVEEGATVDYTAFDCLNTWSQCGQTRMIRKGSYKYVCNMMGDYWLYNIDEDPLETKDLSQDTAYSSVLADMAIEMNAEILRKQDDIPSCKFRYRTKLHPQRYFFDSTFKVEKDPTVKYYEVNCPKKEKSNGKF